MPPKPPKRLKMSLVDKAPPESANEPPSSAVRSDDFLGFETFHYEMSFEEEPSGAGERKVADTGEIVVKTEEPDSPEGVEPETGNLTVEQASVTTDESSDDSFITLPSRRRTKGRSGRSTVPESDDEDVKPMRGVESVHHINGPGEEFISLEPPISWNVDNLGCSGRIVQDKYKIAIHNLGSLMLVDNSFVAKVRIANGSQLNRNRSFRQAKVMLLRQLSIVRVLLDDVTAERNRHRTGMHFLVNQVRSQTATNRASAADAALIVGIVQKSTELTYIELCKQLSQNPAASECLKVQTSKLLEIELALKRRNEFLSRFGVEFFDDTQKLNVFLQQFCKEVAENHRNALLEVAPQSMRHLLTDIPKQAITQIHATDVKMFTDLDQVLNREIFQKPLDDLAKRWSNYVKSLIPGDAFDAVVNPIYFSLCRSLEELIVEIAGITDHNPEELLTSDANGWHAMKSAIRWKTETSLTKCIEREYLFVFRLLKHFDPASANKKQSGYLDNRLLGRIDSKSVLGSWMRPFRRFSRGIWQNSLGIADEFYVWYCLLDDVLHVLSDNDHALDNFEQILKNYVELLNTATFEQMEMIRVITHSIGRFIVQIFLSVSSDKTQSYEDKQILQSQLDAINRTMLEADSTKFFRDLIDVFSSYWKNRCGIIENIPSKNGLAEMEQIKKTLLATVVVALRKNVDAEHVINLFRCLNDFIVDLDDVCFDWYVKSLPEKPMKAVTALEYVKPVDNKWSGTENQTYRVVEPVKFHQILQLLLEGGTGPKHFVFDVISTLLGCIHSQLERARWTSNEGLSESDQVVSSSVLISSIRSSLIYLREQAEYISFDQFLEERIKPFCNVVENSQSLGDFIKRAGMIKESFCYTRKQNEMSVTEALRMYGELNDAGDYNAERLLQAYQQYSDQFVKYMAETVSEGEDEGKADAVSKLGRESAQPVLFKEWTAEFKSMEMPKILAGVASVWSMLVSADVSSTGKYFKPHCIQILCVLRLLGADSGEKGVSKHLAQVLTGQGKSLVLALIASVLALTGHKIQLVCYNDTLVKRDAKEFENLFRVLGVKNSIQYGTYTDMANGVISPMIDGKAMGLRDFVTDLILSGPGNSRPKKPEAPVQVNSVLLMDEVDVFFTKEYYGSRYNPAQRLFISGLDAIQIEIWNTVISAGNHDVHTVKAHIDEYILSPHFARKAQFAEFLNKNATYELLVFIKNKRVRQTFNNKSLFAECLATMIANALHVATSPSQFQDYTINQEGAIAVRVNEKFVTETINQYYAVFNYFRLKKDHFIPYTSSSYNYGYLNIGCGSLSYAMLPKAYPLILGVTGTLTALTQHEKAAIDRLYNINRSSIMPSFFGCSNLQYNPEQNFAHLATKPVWMGKVFTQAHAAVGVNRAVIVFFHDDTLLEEFRAQYCGQFDRLQVLTENTDADKHEHLISEAGVAKTVTLATRGMGRGVDYKSSVAVEKNGGVHVIQSFFSLDVKEETQIRGRTARKDNRGSYELIVLDADLKTQKLVNEGQKREVTYAALDAARTNIALEENENIEKSIEGNTNDHLTTLAYLQSFFN